MAPNPNTNFTPANPATDQNLPTVDGFAHIHPKGGDDRSFVQGPSAADLKFAGQSSAINLVVGAADKKVYFFNGDGVIGKPMKLKDFMGNQMMTTIRHNLRTTGALVLFLLGMGALMAVGQQKTLPSVTSASVPLYPRITQQAHIEGVVRLRISTDGNRVASVEVQSGQPMLAQAAQENVKTWQFEPHSPTTFEVTFRYKLLPSKCDAECNCDSAEKPSVLLQLPAEVEVNAKELMVCDPASTKSRP